MIEYLNYTINPYKGIGNILFGVKIGDIKETLKEERIPFVQSVDLNKGCTPEIPWFYITIDTIYDTTYNINRRYINVKMG